MATHSTNTTTAPPVPPEPSPRDPVLPASDARQARSATRTPQRRSRHRRRGPLRYETISSLSARFDRDRIESENRINQIRAEIREEISRMIREYMAMYMALLTERLSQQARSPSRLTPLPPPPTEPFRAALGNSPTPASKPGFHQTPRTRVEKINALDDGLEPTFR